MRRAKAEAWCGAVLRARDDESSRTGARSNVICGLR